uniref:Uncharacterized protein n=1 Tax=Salix viminalis TaxID=40686 RepID=A0A6N2LHC4_SALVM
MEHLYCNGIKNFMIGYLSFDNRCPSFGVSVVASNSWEKNSRKYASQMNTDINVEGMYVPSDTSQ